MPYCVARIANTWLDYVKQNGSRKEQLSNMKLQKLLYFTQGWHLGAYESPCFYEAIEAWSYGPVISSIYHQFKHFGRGPIRGPIKSRAYTITPVEVAPPVWDDKRVLGIIEELWEAYRERTAMQLVKLTHQAGSPWEQTVTEMRKKFPGAAIQGFVIPNHLIEEYYKQLLQPS